MEKQLIETVLPPWWILIPENGRIGVKNISFDSMIPCVTQMIGSLEKQDLADLDGVVVGGATVTDLEVMRTNGFTWFFPLAALPSLEAPRWFISTENQEVSALGLCLYTPQHWYAKVAKKIIQKTGFLRLFSAERFRQRTLLVIALKQRPPLVSACEVWGGCKVSCFSFSRGAKGPYQKDTAQVVEGNGKVPLYVKIASTTKARERIDQEAHVLSVLKTEPRYACHIPDLRFSGKFGQHYILVQSAIQGGCGPKRLNSEIVVFLSVLVGSVRVQANTLSFWQKTRAKMLSNRDLAGYWNIVEGKLANVIIPITFMHGDFTPWNVLISGGDIQAIDWESGLPEGVPFVDMFHYLLQFGFLVRHWSGKKAFIEVHRLITSTLFRPYLDKVDVDMQIAWLFLEFYIVYALSGGDGPVDLSLGKRYKELLDLSINR